MFAQHTTNTATEHGESMSKETGLLNDVCKAITLHEGQILDNKYFKRVDLPLIKAFNIMIAKRKFKAMKDASLKRRRSTIKFLDNLMPRRKEVRYVQPILSSPCEIVMVGPEPPKPLTDREKQRHDIPIQSVMLELFDDIRNANRLGFDFAIPVNELLSDAEAEYRLFEPIAKFDKKYAIEKIKALYTNALHSKTIKGTGWIRDLTIEGIEPNPGPRTNNPSRPRSRKNRGNRPRRRVNRNSNNSLVANENRIEFNHIMPPRKLSTLKYLDNATVRNSPGNTYLVYSMRINDLFDPDPLILSGSVSNFKEMMQFYSYYRVLASDIKWSVINLEAFPLTCGIVFSQTNLTGSIASLGAAQDAFENDFVVSQRTISAKGGMDKTVFKLTKLDIGRLLGVPRQYRSESNYAGNGLATPPVPLWANFIVYSPTGAAMNSGYTNSTTLFFTTEFFGRLNVRA